MPRASLSLTVYRTCLGRAGYGLELWGLGQGCGCGSGTGSFPPRYPLLSRRNQEVCLAPSSLLLPLFAPQKEAYPCRDEMANRVKPELSYQASSARL